MSKFCGVRALCMSAVLASFLQARVLKRACVLTLPSTDLQARARTLHQYAYAHVEAYSLI